MSGAKFKKSRTGFTIQTQHFLMATDSHPSLNKQMYQLMFVVLTKLTKTKI